MHLFPQTSAAVKVHLDPFGPSILWKIRWHYGKIAYIAALRVNKKCTLWAHNMIIDSMKYAYLCSAISLRLQGPIFLQLKMTDGFPRGNFQCRNSYDMIWFFIFYTFYFYYTILIYNLLFKIDCLTCGHYSSLRKVCIISLIWWSKYYMHYHYDIYSW